jgi:hypothetical protein
LLAMMSRLLAKKKKSWRIRFEYSWIKIVAPIFLFRLLLLQKREIHHAGGIIWLIFKFVILQKQRFLSDLEEWLHVQRMESDWGKYTGSNLQANGRFHVKQQCADIEDIFYWNMEFTKR